MVEAIIATHQTQNECCVCIEVFEVEGPLQPLSLQCGHVVCSGCAKQLKEDAIGKGEKSYPCPYCRVPTSTDYEPIKNYGMIGLIGAKEQQHRPSIKGDCASRPSQQFTKRRPLRAHSQEEST